MRILCVHLVLVHMPVSDVESAHAWKEKPLVFARTQARFHLPVSIHTHVHLLYDHGLVPSQCDMSQCDSVTV
jgi:hypothetical protein